MIILWIVTGASLVASFVAIRAVRRIARRQDELSQQYWELRYQQSELRARMTPGATQAPADSPAPPSRAPAEAFVPLSAVKR